MGRPRTVLPGHDKIKRHKNGRARVWYRPPFGPGSWHYLGPWDDDENKPSEAAIAAYWRLVDLIRRDEAGPALKSTDWLIAELLAEYFSYTKSKLNDRERRQHAATIKRLIDRYGDTPVRHFGPAQLGEWQRWLGETLTRSSIDKERRVLFAAFRWAFKKDRIRVNETRWAEMQFIAPPAKDECRPPRRISPVSAWTVGRTLRHLRPTVAAMVRFQWLTGCRPGDLFVMRPGDVHRAGRVTLPGGAVIDVDAVNHRQRVKLWLYVVPEHKTEHHGHDRYLWLPPKAQAVIEPFLNRPAESLLFTPKQSLSEWRTQQRQERRSPVQPSQIDRSIGSPRKRPGFAFNGGSYRQAIIRAAERAGVPIFNGYQIRHAFLTNARNKDGVVSASLLAGHRSHSVIQGYTKTAAEAERTANALRELASNGEFNERRRKLGHRQS